MGRSPVFLQIIIFLSLVIGSPSFTIKPAFEHELLKNHKIQKHPSEIPNSIQIKHKSKWETREAHVSTWQCPKGTVPIWKYERTNSTDESSAFLIGGSPHEHAIGSTITSTKMYGAKATISVWDPTVESRDEFSLSQIWITSGSYKENNLNSIEAGWQVLPNLYQDSKPRLFIFWTVSN
ncbi:unnamed protein product [Arabidopsis thaliana]|uniref:Neprosin PEP catalytic domain-containing protein n=1 Tax=Arabidopsis thaliana TaxID=3702 RepID=A0A5S9WX06_ARATH|nr:unnamed protein product [Arabidopsis thaliana]